jgi:hypothetical protein
VATQVADLAGRFDEFAVGREGMKSQTLDEKALRDENARAQGALRHSEERWVRTVQLTAFATMPSQKRSLEHAVPLLWLSRMSFILLYLDEPLRVALCLPT